MASSETVPLLSLKTTNGAAKVYPRDRLGCFFAFVLLGCAAIISRLIVIIPNQFYPIADRLPDVLLSYLPLVPECAFVADICGILGPIFAIILFSAHKHRWIVYRRVFTIAALLYFMRAACLPITILPPPFPIEWCNEKFDWNNTANSWYRVFTTSFSMGAGKHMCGETIWSGHLITYLLPVLGGFEYAKGSLSFLLITICGANAIVGFTSVMLARYHYTIDVVISYYFITRTWWIYHTLCLMQRQPPCDGECPLEFHAERPAIQREWWHSVFSCFESNTPEGLLPFALEWPLPWPQMCVDRFETYNDGQ